MGVAFRTFLSKSGTLFIRKPLQSAGPYSYIKLIGPAPGAGFPALERTGRLQRALQVLLPAGVHRRLPQ